MFRVVAAKEQGGDEVFFFPCTTLSSKFIDSKCGGEKMNYLRPPLAENASSSLKPGGRVKTEIAGLCRHSTYSC